MVQVRLPPPTGTVTEGLTSDYAVNLGSSILSDTGNHGPFLFSETGRGLLFKDITDGLSNTLLFGEKQVELNQFGKGWSDFTVYSGRKPVTSGRHAGPAYPLALDQFEPVPGETGPFGSVHDGVVQFAFGDGRVQALSVSVSVDVLGYLADRDDGQAVREF